MPQHPPFELVWSRISGRAGDGFETKRGLPFTYVIDGDGLVPDQTHYRLSRGNFARAYALVPFDGPGSVNSLVRGPSYVRAILHDARIRARDY